MKVSELRMLCPSILTHSRGGTNTFLSSLEAIQLPHLPEKMESQLVEKIGLLSACLCLKSVSYS